VTDGQTDGHLATA